MTMAMTVAVVVVVVSYKGCLRSFDPLTPLARIVIVIVIWDEG